MASATMLIAVTMFLPWAVAATDPGTRDLPPATSASVYTLVAHVLAAPATPSGNACYRLQATLAEPVAGYASNQDYALSTGYRALVQGTLRDEIFFSGFEVCP